MSDFNKLFLKVADLKAKIENESVSPRYLGALLDDIVSLMQSIDMSSFKDVIRSAYSNALAALDQLKVCYEQVANQNKALGVLSDSVSLLFTELEKAAKHPVSLKDISNADFVVADEFENPIVSVAGGHVSTANFDSRSTVDSASFLR